MDYSFNYAFLRTFMEERHLQKRDLLEAFGMTDYVSLNKWLDGKVPVHILAILRFCNYYNVPVTQFFVDGDAIPPSPYPSQQSQTQPTDNYGNEPGKAGFSIIETRVTTRKISTANQSSAVEEGLKRQAEQQRLRDEALGVGGGLCKSEIDEQTLASVDNNTAIAILKIELDHCREMQRNEYDRLMSKILEQQQEIQRLRAEKNHILTNS